jgi:SAM-dependent methyltransferase
MSATSSTRSVIDDFSSHIEAFLALATLPSGSLSFDRVTEGEHGLLSSIRTALNAGVPLPVIEDMLAPVNAQLTQCLFYRRTHTWPRGYPGDFETVEMMCYPQKFVTQKQSLADWLQEHVLAQPATQQHRNKVVKQALLMLEAALWASPETRILSVACGGCPDLRMILPLLKKFPGRFVLVDSDADALAFSRAELGAFAASCDFVNLSFLRYVKQAARNGEKFDLILAGGLFDYLNDDAIVAFIGTSNNELLKPGGRLFFTNITDNDHFNAIEFLARWKLIKRTKESIFDLCRRANIDTSQVHLEREATGITLLVDVRKP